MKVQLPPEICRGKGTICAGIDVGSQSTDAVLIGDSGQIYSYSIRDTSYDVTKSARLVYEECLEKAGIKKEDVAMVISTGYGRERVDFADERITEITCHARGAKALFSETRSIIDIGGQDSKAIRINDDGRIIDFTMNDKCAAGTGRFLENMARVLDLSIQDMVKMGLSAGEEVKISSMCTVFAESEVISLIHQGKTREAIIKGLFRAIAARVSPMMKRLGLVDEVTMTGGVAKNKGVVEAMKEEIGKKINVPEEPQIVGALGASIIALSKVVENS